MAGTGDEMRHRSSSEIALSSFSWPAAPRRGADTDTVAVAVSIMNFEEAAAMTIACSVPSARARASPNLFPSLARGHPQFGNL